VVPDELIGIQNAVIAALPECDFVVVSGGTGLGPRDLTPQAVAGIADYEVPGLGELLRRESEKYSRNAYLSRCGGWVLGQKLVLAVPGNPKAAVEQLGILEDLLPHVILSLRGECKHRRSPAT
jgi:molybdenum cofactor synthesis domain-containing protein